jgi:hypothetical protein
MEVLPPSSSTIAATKDRPPPSSSSVLPNESLPATLLTLAEFAAQNEEFERRNAERTRVAAILAEDDDEERERETQQATINEDAEWEFGTTATGNIRGALRRIGTDLRTEAGVRCFGGRRQEREFNPRWVEGVEWLQEGMLEEDLELVKVMLALGEDLPRDLILWCMEHVAFERSQILAKSYSDIFLTSLVIPELGGANDREEFKFLQKISIIYLFNLG